MKYFQHCTTIDEVKALYRTLSKQHHPDKGGDLAIMQAINNEYSFAIAKVKKGENLSEDETQAAILEAEAYRQAIEKIINIEGITIEVVGTWIWVTGNTRPVKDQIKEAGFVWAHKKEAWYFRTAEYKTRNRTKMDLDQIRVKYGSQKVQGTWKSFSKIEK